MQRSAVNCSRLKTFKCCEEKNNKPGLRLRSHWKAFKVKHLGRHSLSQRQVRRNIKAHLTNNDAADTDNMKQTEIKRNRRQPSGDAQIRTSSEGQTQAGASVDGTQEAWCGEVLITGLNSSGQPLDTRSKPLPPNGNVWENVFIQQRFWEVLEPSADSGNRFHRKTVFTERGAWNCPICLVMLNFHWSYEVESKSPNTTTPPNWVQNRLSSWWQTEGLIGPSRNSSPLVWNSVSEFYSVVRQHQVLSTW